MTEMLERVARAIHEKLAAVADIDTLATDLTEAEVREVARAAIEAILRDRGFYVPKPEEGWKQSFTDAERRKLLPIAETLAMLDGNAFFGVTENWADQYLAEAHAIYEDNGGDKGWAGQASFVKALTPNTPAPASEPEP